MEVEKEEEDSLMLWHVRMCVKCRCDEEQIEAFYEREKNFFFFAFIDSDIENP